MLRNIPKIIIMICMFFIPVTISGCTGGEVLGTYIAIAIAKSLADNTDYDSNENDESETTTTRKSTNIKPAKTLSYAPARKTSSKPTKRYTSSISPQLIKLYKDLRWSDCLSLAAKVKKSPRYSPYDKCTARIIAGAIYYQRGKTDAAAGYFSSSCTLNNSPARELLSPEIIKFYQKINSY